MLRGFGEQTPEMDGSRTLEAGCVHGGHPHADERIDRWNSHAASKDADLHQCNRDQVDGQNSCKTLR